MPAELLFARYHPKDLQPKNSIGAKWLRLLDQLDLGATVAKKRVAIKMHLGGGTGFTTVHPFFVRKLVEKLKAAGAKQVFVTDVPSAVASAAERGYAPETIGCQLIPATGSSDRYYYRRPIEPPFYALTEVELAGEIMDAEVLLDLSHIKGHGDCGFGGASKNLSMGAVSGNTRKAIHALEGGMNWNEEKCSHCGACRDNCPNQAISFDAHQKFKIFYHHCKFCQHCVLQCPQQALTLDAGRYRDFQQGMALTTARVLEAFTPGRALFISLLMDITIYCDCWGMTTPALVPDIGILAGRDIVAIEQAALDLIRTEDLIHSTLPEGVKLGKKGHLFERIHRKDPYVVVEALAELGCGKREYKLREIE